MRLHCICFIEHIFSFILHIYSYETSNGIRADQQGYVKNLGTQLAQVNKSQYNYSRIYWSKSVTTQICWTTEFTGQGRFYSPRSVCCGFFLSLFSKVYSMEILAHFVLNERMNERHEGNEIYKFVQVDVDQIAWWMNGWMMIIWWYIELLTLHYQIVLTYHLTISG